jgi:alpha-beta hydrolase superfamily lysophospholipase
MFKYLPPFLHGGWNLILYDHRAHGESGGRYPGYGAFETADLAEVAAYARRRWPAARRLLLYGESMGAAIVLQYAARDGELAGVIADCPFTDLCGELRHRLMSMNVPRPLHGLLLAAARRGVLRRAGFDIRRVHPGEDVMGSSVPLLLMHGQDDDYVPAAMSRELFERRKERALTRLQLIPEARHAEAVSVDPPGYYAAVERFLDELRERESGTGEKAAPGK